MVAALFTANVTAYLVLPVGKIQSHTEVITKVLSKQRAECAKLLNTVSIVPIEWNRRAIGEILVVKRYKSSVPSGGNDTSASRVHEPGTSAFPPLTA